LGEEGKAQFAVYPIDGKEVFATVANTNGIRALLALPQDNRLYGVAGRTIFATDPSGSVSVVGSLLADGFTTMAANRRSSNPQIAITASGSNILVTNGAAATISDADLPPANSVSEVNNYFIWTIDDGRIFASALGDGSTIDPLSFAEAESKADKLVRGYTANNLFMAFGTSSTDFFTDVGTTPFPLQREHSNEVGLLAGASVATVEQQVMFVADDGTVRRLNGYQATRVSEGWVERAIADDADRASIIAFTWFDRGHTFYAISGTAFTAIYDAMTGLWHEARSYGFNRWNFAAATTYAGRTVFGSLVDGKLMTSGPSLTSEAGAVIMCEVRCPLTHASPTRLQWDTLHVDVIPNTLTTGTPGTGPLFAMDYSEDGGRTWSAQRIVDAVALGERMGRVPPFRRLGIAPPAGRTVRFTWDASAVRGITGAVAEVTKLRA
jgi:hypothetical protein